jgi:hypothetical protein
VHGVLGHHATVYYGDVALRDVYLQTIDDGGHWIALNLGSVMREHFPDCMISSGINHPEERVVFDSSADAYTIVRTEINGDFLLHSNDMTNWKLHPLALPGVGSYWSERTASDYPPVIFAYTRVSQDCDGGSVSIIAPKKGGDGSLLDLKYC